jgi:MFS family permease
MASLMITGGKLGEILGRKRAFGIGCVICGCGSFVTATSQSLAVLIAGWSVLEGIGAASSCPRSLRSSRPTSSARGGRARTGWLPPRARLPSPPVR